MAITSFDVARLAGVSQPTVSRALRDSRGVSTATRRKVRDAARALGYVPIHSGRALSTKSAGRVGIVSAELSNPFYPALIAPLHDGLARAGYRTILITDKGDEPLELEPLIDGSLDGVIVTTSERSSSLPGELLRRGVPCVLVNRSADHVEVDRCVPDNAEGARTVAQFLLDLGHRRIAVIGGPEATSTGFERVLAFREHLARNRFPVPDEWVRQVPFSADAGREEMLDLLRHKPTSVFCANDALALGALNAAHASGVRVPQHITVVGWDDIPMSAWDQFSLTTVSSSLDTMASSAVELLLRRIADPSSPATELVVTPRLILRGTHGRVAQAS